MGKLLLQRAPCHPQQMKPEMMGGVVHGTVTPVV